MPSPLDTNTNDRGSSVHFEQPAQDAFDDLKQRAPSEKLARSLFNAVNRQVERIKQDRECGHPYAKHRIPQVYRERYGATNLFRLELSQFWRLTYTISSFRKPDGRIIVLILDILTHPEYDKLFGYAKK